MDYTTTEAWARGIERAADQLALLPPDPQTTSVSLEEDGHRELSYFALCKLCPWARDSPRCPHLPKGVVAIDPSSTTVTDDG